eukprot:773196-Pelagomonas_calceolata.AAC.6
MPLRCPCTGHARLCYALALPMHWPCTPLLCPCDAHALAMHAFAMPLHCPCHAHADPCLAHACLCFALACVSWRLSRAGPPRSCFAKVQ